MKWELMALIGLAILLVVVNSQPLLQKVKSALSSIGVGRPTSQRCLTTDSAMASTYALLDHFRAVNDADGIALALKIGERVLAARAKLPIEEA